jgi:hypothetical protein
VACAASAALSLAATFVQQLETPYYYTWRNYTAWVDCIDTQVRLAEDLGKPIRVWQTHVPDVLVALADRHPGIGTTAEGYDFTRALDLEARIPEAEEYGRTTDILIFSRAFNLSRSDEVATWGRSQTPPPAVYDGTERPADRELMKDPVEVPFGPWALGDPGLHGRERHVCQVGPFWAEIWRKRT